MIKVPEMLSYQYECLQASGECSGLYARYNSFESWGTSAYIETLRNSLGPPPIAHARLQSSRVGGLRIRIFGTFNAHTENVHALVHVSIDDSPPNSGP